MKNKSIDDLKNEIQRKKDIRKFIDVLSGFQKTLDGIKKEIKEKKDPSDEVKVSNFPEQRKSIKVENLNEIEIPNELKVNNLEDIKIPEPPETLKLEKPKWFSLKGITESLSEIKQSIVNIQIPSFDKYTKKKNALAVRLVDKDGNQYYTAGGGGGNMGNGQDSGKTRISSSDGRVWEQESNGAMPVNIQDQTSETVDVFLTQFLNNVTLASDVSIDDKTFDAVAGHNIAVGDMICFKEGTRFMQAQVTAVNSNTITIRTPFDFAFTTSANVCRSNRNLAVDGSVTPVVFRIGPFNLDSGVEWDITWMVFHLEHSLEADDSKFGGISAISNGIVVRKKDGLYKNIFTAWNNAEFAHHCKRLEYSDKAGGGLFATRAYKEFSGQENSGVTIRLTSDGSEELEVIVQDDLTGLVAFHVLAHGHVVTD